MSDLTPEQVNRLKFQAATLLCEGLFGIGGTKQFKSQAALTKIVPSPNKSNTVIRNPALFQGEIYTDKTRLPPHRWSIFKAKSPVPKPGGLLTKKFELIFIMGYELNLRSGQLYELWYNTQNGTYIILDRYASPVTSNITYLDDAITDFVNIISEENPSLRRNELTYKETNILKNIARRNRSVEEAREEICAVEMLLEATTATRAFLTKTLNQQVVEYHHTHMNSRAVKSFWQFWGKYVEMPQKYLSTGLVGTAQKIIGKERIAVFIVGLSLQNRIDVELWYVKDPKTGLGSYYVFDLTSLQIVGSNIKTLRQAYVAMGKKIALPQSILNVVK